ncbi:MAG: addiction module protein [Nitrosomonas sp.]|uniref:addiction module protein n=1 Tax=Nitrosomonas sp. TaxID=42353 RepID=UPI002732BFC9|nr:addiction module protein [Nitrosomonas sp.]MDP1933722.1 addiction module protein [Nitrosomonas sp.]MDP3664656.1 addiction module protein [Nitrosomonas sp.]MDZ4106137.1 addiction module protein [Nitrosomonas sp.]
MKTEILNKLLSEALLLPEAERAELAHALVKSLDAPDDVGALEAWNKEILRRVKLLVEAANTDIEPRHCENNKKHGVLFRYRYE